MRTLLILALVPNLLGAQVIARHAPLSAPGAAPLLSARADLRLFMPRSEEAWSVRQGAAWAVPRADSHRTRRFAVVGAIVGAATGAVVGTIASQSAGCGCSDTQKTLGSTVWVGAIGSVVGAATGALVGHFTPRASE